MSKQLEIKFKGKQLGKLPQNILSQREYFILGLWQSLLIDGAKFTDNKGRYDVKLKQGNLNELLEYVQKKYPDYKIQLLPQTTRKEIDGKGKEVLVNVPERLSVIFANGQSTTFDPYNIADLAYQIGGPDVFIKPKPTEIGPLSLSPLNPALIKFLKPFASKDELRPALTGIYFNKEKNAVAVTNAHTLIAIEGTGANHVLEQGIFSVDGQARPIDERYVDYSSAIPKSSQIFLTVDSTAFLTNLKSVDKFANKVTHQIELVKEGKDTLKIMAEDVDNGKETALQMKGEFVGYFENIGFNAKMLITLIEGMLKVAAPGGNTKSKNKGYMITFQMTRPNKAVIIEFETKFGKGIFLQMPLKILKEEKQEGNTKPIERQVDDTPRFRVNDYVKYYGIAARVIAIKSENNKRSLLAVAYNGKSIEDNESEFDRSDEGTYLFAKQEYNRPPRYAVGDYVESRSGRIGEIVEILDERSDSGIRKYAIKFENGEEGALTEDKIIKINRSKPIPSTTNALALKVAVAKAKIKIALAIK